MPTARKNKDTGASASAHQSEGAPVHGWHMDLIGPLKETQNGFKYVLTLTDYFTKFVEFFPLKRKSGEEVARGICTFVYRY